MELDVLEWACVHGVCASAPGPLACLRSTQRLKTSKATLFAFSRLGRGRPPNAKRQYSGPPKQLVACETRFIKCRRSTRLAPLTYLLLQTNNTTFL